MFDGLIFDSFVGVLVDSIMLGRGLKMHERLDEGRIVSLLVYEFALSHYSRAADERQRSRACALP